MHINMAFGKTGLQVTLPPGPQYDVLHAHSASPLPDVHAALSEALDAPIGRPSLLELATGKKSAAISVCDITGPCPTP